MISDNLIAKQFKVIDNLESTDTENPLSANQGRVVNLRLGGFTFVKKTQAGYDDLTNKDPNTVYIVPKVKG